MYKVQIHYKDLYILFHCIDCCLFELELASSIISKNKHKLKIK